MSRAKPKSRKLKRNVEAILSRGQKTSGRGSGPRAEFNKLSAAFQRAIHDDDTSVSSCQAVVSLRECCTFAARD